MKIQRAIALMMFTAGAFFSAPISGRADLQQPSAPPQQTGASASDSAPSHSPEALAEVGRSPTNTQPNLTNVVLDFQIQLGKERIRQRLGDYRAMLEAEYKVSITNWEIAFLSAREGAIASTAADIIKASDRIRRAHRLDASEVKNHPDFLRLLREQVASALKSESMTGELSTWGSTVESFTRARMIQCFQQIIAEDLGRSFDESLSNQVVKAVRAIPVAALCSGLHANQKIEETILASLPESAISADVRAAVSRAAGTLARATAAMLVPAIAVAAEAHGVHAGDKIMQIEPLIEEAAAQVTPLVTDYVLRRLNDRITPTPDPAMVQASIENVLRDWNGTHLQPRLEAILAQFLQNVVAHVEAQARKAIIVDPRLVNTDL